MRVLIFAPNAGVSLSTGGGTNFVLKQADILSELGHEVTIAGYHALTPTELELIHGIPLLHRSPNQPIRVIGSISDAAFNVARESRGKISPYFVLLDPRFGRWMRRVVTMVDPQLVWFHDDIPKAVVPSLGNRRVIVYVHYPLEARNTGTPKLANNMVTTSERIIRRSLTCLSPKIVSPLSSDFIEMVWANSSVTRRVLGQFLGVKAEYIPTYIDPVQSVCAGELKLDRVLSIGAFQRAKEQELLIRALAVPAAHGYRTTIDLVGNMRDSAYLEELKGEAKKGDGALVKFHVDASRKELEETLRESSVYVHCAEFEPFGLSVLEAMARGMIAIVRLGPWSGPWLDIVEEGTWGEGFSTPSELREILLDKLPKVAGDLSKKSLKRSAAFSRDRLKQSLERVM